MSAHIKRLQPKEQQKTQEKLRQLQLILLEFPELNEQKVSSLLWEAKRKNNLQESNKWTFIMISPEQNRMVVNWLEENSKRPLKALKLWALLFEYVHRDTGQIMLSRQEIAKEIHLYVNSVTNIMTELESIGAIIKRKEGRGVIYYMNPNIANHYPQEIRERAQKKAPKLTFFEGGKIQ